MKFGLSDSEYEFINQTVVLPLMACGATVWCFGSRARGNHQRFSDLDLMVEGPAEIQSLVAAISEKLLDSNFAYKVDLVELRSFAKSYLENYYRERILWNPDSGS